MRNRLVYAKNVKLRFTSVLDIQSIWEQSIRRAGLLLEYSSGFHPQPKIQIALPLPLGYTSNYEIVDFWTIYDTPAQNIIASLQNAVPEGIEIKSIEEIKNNQKSIVNQIHSSDYILTFFPEKEDTIALSKNITNLKMSKKITRSKCNKEYDLRPLILELHIDNRDPIKLFMRLTSQPGRTGRPDEVAKELGFDLTDYLVERTAINLSINVSKNQFH